MTSTGWQRWGATPSVSVAFVEPPDTAQWQAGASRLAGLGAVLAGVLALHLRG